MFKTYNEIYQAICALPRNDQQSEPQLAQYLTQLLGLSLQFRHRLSFTLEEFYGLLADAFEMPPLTEPPALLTPTSKHGFDEDSFEYWHHYVLVQIESLQLLYSSDALDSALAVFGASGNGSGTWYNWTMYSFLERAASAHFQTYSEPIDVDPEDIVTWGGLCEFLEAGRFYE